MVITAGRAVGGWVSASESRVDVIAVGIVVGIAVVVGLCRRHVRCSGLIM